MWNIYCQWNYLFFFSSSSHNWDRIISNFLFFPEFNFGTSLQAAGCGKWESMFSVLIPRVIREHTSCWHRLRSGSRLQLCLPADHWHFPHPSSPWWGDFSPLLIFTPVYCTNKTSRDKGCAGYLSQYLNQLLDCTCIFNWTIATIRDDAKDVSNCIDTCIYINLKITGNTCDSSVQEWSRKNKIVFFYPSAQLDISCLSGKCHEACFIFKNSPFLFVHVYDTFFSRQTRGGHPVFLCQRHVFL